MIMRVVARSFAQDRALVPRGASRGARPGGGLGGGLFRPGDPRGPSGVERALAALERASEQIDEATTERIAGLVTQDAAMSSEHIAVLYEGLLDFELRRAPDEDAVVILAIGDRPALPFARLERMSQTELTTLFARFESSARPSRDRRGRRAPKANDDCLAEASNSARGSEGAGHPEAATERLGARIHDWAERVTENGASKLVQRIVAPGQWFLAHWVGARKGSGTFYTRPQLAGPTARRALRPLAYRQLSRQDDPAADDTETLPALPREPEEILALRVCDPAMGSGSLLVAALRYLTDALLQSVQAHDRLSPSGELVIEGLADDAPIPRDAPAFESLLRARLARHIAERCIYGVDIDPVAVELARLAIWLEAMDSSLSLERLEHTLKWGNALVGCWLDQARDYPIMAWEREGGDRHHKRFVHHYWVERRGDDPPRKRGDKWDRAIKSCKNNVIKPAMARAIESPETLSFAPADLPPERRKAALDAWCAIWFWPGDALEHAPTPESAKELPAPSAALIREIADTERFFHWEIEFPEIFDRPGPGFDAILGNPPWEIQKPSSMELFSALDPLYRGYTKQRALDRQAELFAADSRNEERWLEHNARLKALSNWVRHVSAPFGDPRESPSGKGIALARGKKNAALHGRWRQARAARRGGRQPERPFRYQGSADINTYKLFLELAHSLLCHGGRLGFLVPSGLYTDNGSKDLRALLLEGYEWSHLYALQNSRFVFAGVHNSFKIVMLHATKGGVTRVVHTRFRLGPGDSPTLDEIADDIDAMDKYLALPVEQIHRFSPNTAAFLELRSQRDLAILETLHGNGVLLGDDRPNGWDIEYAREFDMTNDSRLFPPRPRWEARGYKPDEHGHWLAGRWRRGSGHAPSGERDWSVVRSADGREQIAIEDIDDVALPFVQGAMLQQFDFSQKAWVSGTGLRAVWRPITWDHKELRPQFLMSIDRFDQPTGLHFKPAIRRIARNTDTRMMIAGLVPRLPCGDVASVLLPRKRHLQTALVGCLDSYVCDLLARERCGGTHLDYHHLAEIPLPRPERAAAAKLGRLTLQLAGAHPLFAPLWLDYRASSQVPWRALWAITDHERLRLRAILDAVVAALYGISRDDFAWILRDCDLPVERVTKGRISRALDPKGFWRVDKHRPPELRQTVLSLVAFDVLKNLGIDGFLAMSDGQGWMLPETLRLADHGLGRDARAKEPQPVASALGPRFRAWQVAQSHDESWDECARRAALLDRIVLRSSAR